MRRSASACEVCSSAPMFLPTSTSAMSIETISNAVPASRPFGEHRLRDAVGILEHFLVIDGGADRRHDALADARDDRRLARAADVAVEVAAHRDARLDVQLNAVLRDALEDRRLDDLRIDRRLQRFEHVAPGEIDRGRALPFERNLRALRGDHRERDVVDVAAGEVVRLHLIDGQRQAGLARAHEVGDDEAGRDADQAHPDQRDDRERHARGDRANPQAERKVVQEDQEHR